ncbi:MAG: integrin alpha [Planctomycetes bacterium]|jgi:hypothetical protein|nr:integrin alpha [Planctomycetota bacterium]
MRAREAAVAVFVFFILSFSGAGAGPHLRSRTFNGSATDEALGWFVAPAGDVDADGSPDVIASARGAEHVKVYSGADGSVLYTRTGASSGDAFGFVVAGAGDVNGDGHDDFIAGAYLGGYARVFSGKDGSILHALTGATNGDEFGYSVAGVGDLDGDGSDDVAVGAPLATDGKGNQTGSVTVFSGADGSALLRLYGDAYLDRLGDAVSYAGDLDGDGTLDIAAGASWGTSSDGNTFPGYVKLFSGVDGSTLYTWYGPSSDSLFGFSVSCAGDLDGDGADDVIIGAPLDEGAGMTENGSVWLVTAFGDMLGFAEGDADYDQFGYAVAGGGDLDGDGVADPIVGANLAYDSSQNVTGIVRAFSGAGGGEMWTIEGQNDGMRFGEALAYAGDTNGDGLADFVVGAPGNDVGTTTGAGSAYLYVSPSPTGTLSIDGGARATGSTSVTLYLSWQAGGATVTDLRLRNAGGAWGDWRSLSASIPWTLPASEGERTVEVQFRDFQGYVSGPKSDSIIYDVTAPFDCAIALAGGAAWINSTTVQVTLSHSDAQSGVAQLRLRNQGGVFGDWVNVAPVVSHTLTAGAGAKTVEAEFRDFAGNVSGTVSDSIGLDPTIPTITSFLVDSGNAFTGWLPVELSITAVDSGGSGLSHMRFRRTGEATFGAWVPWAGNAAIDLLPGDGAKNIEAQVRDGAGNVSGTASDMIALDQTGPSVTAFTVNGGRPYVAPAEGLVVELSASDAGSGLDVFSVTFDNGTTFTDWTAVVPGAVPVARPATAGAVPVRVRARDRVGNVSPLTPATTIYLLSPGMPHLGTGGAIAGSTSGRADVDAAGIDLVAGDLLTVKLKAAGANRKAGFPLVVDLAALDGTRILTGVTAISGHVATYTGRHLLVLRLAEAAGSETGTWSLSVKVKLGAANAKGKGTHEGSFSFEAAEGALVKIALKGTGLDPASVVLEGPDGPVAAAVAGKPGSAKFTATLDRGTGTYTVRFAAPGPVSTSFSVKLPKGSSLTE